MLGDIGKRTGGYLEHKAEKSSMLNQIQTIDPAKQRGANIHLPAPLFLYLQTNAITYSDWIIALVHTACVLRQLNILTPKNRESATRKPLFR